MHNTPSPGSAAAIEQACTALVAYSSEDILNEMVWAQKTIVACLLSDLMHFCDSRCISFDDTLATAKIWYDSEVAE